VTPAPAAAVPGVALQLRAVTQRFGATVALHDAGLTLRAGTVHALLGENGAGKTTLMRIAYGMMSPDAGEIIVQGTRHAFRSPADAITAGLGMVHQHFTLVPAMTVAENLALGRRGAYSAREAARRVGDVAALTGFALDAGATVESLPVGAQQRVEIAKALARDARVLILDEPTGVLAPAEVDDLLRWLRRYVAGGNAAVLITHKLREALAVAAGVRRTPPRRSSPRR
jgi:general nucleoside transport system ATP-binding protein